MLDIVMGYVLIALALLVPSLLLAGFVWVLIHPLDLDEVDRHQQRTDRPVDHAEGETVESGGERPAGPGRAA